MPERRALETYGGLCRFLSAYPDVSVNAEVKRLEITELEKYLESGKKATVEGEYRIVEETEEKDDEGRKTGACAGVGEDAADGG